MSNLYDRPLPLIPAPQRITLQPGRWRAPGKLHKDKRRPATLEKREGAYTLRTTANGAIAWARDAAGWRHAHATHGQLRTLAGDGPVPLVEIEDWPDLEVRGIHLDLKYMMHRKDYLLRWLDDLASYKINTLLLEYEDKFPYRSHPALRHPAAFDESQLRKFLSHARSLGLHVVPLIQTLGHVEYILKHTGFAHLRKNGFHTEYDTLHPETWPFIRSILDEVLEYHGPDEWFHVGGDECWHLKQEKPSVRARLYGAHMAQVMGHLRKHGKRPLLWDDMVRLLPDRERASALRTLPKETILCYWNYDSTPCRPTRSDASGFDRPHVWAEYRRAGFDTLAIPCHDWGPIVPYYARYTVPNTLAMIHDAVRTDSPGLINSHWACFHCPLPLQDYGIALTADRAWKISSVPDARDFDEAYCRLKLGLADRTFLEALYQMDGMLEMPTKLGRGVHLPYFYYMDAVLHYPNGHADRLKYGPAAPPEGVDWAAIVRKKLALLENSPVRAESLRGLERIRDQGAAARHLLVGIGHHAQRSRDLVELVQWLAAFRHHAADRMLALASGSRKTAPLLRESRRLRRGMRRVYGRFMDPRDYVAEEASLFDGEEQLLAR